MGAKQAIAADREYSVAKANELIRRAKVDLTLAENRLMSFIFSKIKPTDTELKWYTFTVQDYLRVCGKREEGKNYVDVKKMLQGLRDKSFWLIEPDGHETTVGWLDKVRINRGSGRISVRLDDNIQEYVIGLQSKGNYTQYTLLSILPMSSSYSIRLFELLKSYADMRKKYTIKRIEIEELKAFLEASHYTAFRDFRRRVLDVAITEINVYSDIEVTWTPEKRGQKVIALEFQIKTKSIFEITEAKWNASDVLEGQMTIKDFLKEKGDT